MANSESTSVPWTSWILFGLFVAVGFVLFYFLHRNGVPAVVRWTVTGLWVLVTLLLGSADLEGDPIGLRKLLQGLFQGKIDSGAVDRWTISHTGAGLVFGVWLLPLLLVVPLVVAWEMFEWAVPGFGENESILNRVVDVSVAVLGWLLVIGIAHLLWHVPFPLLHA